MQDRKAALALSLMITFAAGAQAQDAQSLV